MKRIRIYLIGILSALFIISCDDESNPSYDPISLETEELVFDYGDLEVITPETKEVRILGGNGNLKGEYVDMVNDTAIAKVDLVEDRVIVTTNQKFGEFEYRIKGWATDPVMLKIVVRRNEDLLLTKEKIDLKVGDEATFEIYSGTPDYSAKVSVEGIIDMQMDGDKFTIKALKKGETEIIVTDGRSTTDKVLIVVDDAMVPITLTSHVEGERVFIIIDNEPIIIKFEGGNGGYSLTGAYGSYTKVEMDEESKTLSVVGTRRGLATLTIKDRYNQELKIPLNVDFPFLENATTRIFMNNSMPTLQSTVRIVEHVPSLNLSILQSGSASSGRGISFSGDLEVGKKTNARIYSTGRNGVETANSSKALSECEIVQKKDGTYWITFTEKESGISGYIVLSEP